MNADVVSRKDNELLKKEKQQSKGVTRGGEEKVTESMLCGPVAVMVL